jgi:hypothetical protein
MNSFIAHGHNVNLYAYGCPSCVPSAVHLRPAEEILPHDRVVVANGGYEHFSDVFRYHLLSRQGGWWIDTDVVCNSATIPVTDLAFAREGKFATIANGQIKFPKGHRVLEEARAFVDTHSAGDWGATGPRLLTALIEGTEVEQHQWETRHFYPLLWAEAAKFLLPEYREEIDQRTQDSLFIHIYTSRFRRSIGFNDRINLPPKGSYLDALYNRFGIGEYTGRLTPVDEAALRARIAAFTNQDKIKAILAKEELSFNMTLNEKYVDDTSRNSI